MLAYLGSTAVFRDSIRVASSSTISVFLCSFEIFGVIILAGFSSPLSCSAWWQLSLFCVVGILSGDASGDDSLLSSVYLFYKLLFNVLLYLIIKTLRYIVNICIDNQ